MTIHDFPQDFPDVTTRKLSGFKLDIMEPSGLAGLCEICNKSDSSHIFNVGNVLHHLCKECFEKMLTEFQEQIKR